MEGGFGFPFQGDPEDLLRGLREFAEQQAETVLEALRLTSDDTLLDVGCGGGVFLRRALETGSTAVGVDHSRDMVRLARKTTEGRARIVRASAEQLPFGDGEFTAVSSLVAFFFFPDPVA